MQGSQPIIWYCRLTMGLQRAGDARRRKKEKKKNKLETLSIYLHTHACVDTLPLCMTCWIQTFVSPRVCVCSSSDIFFSFPPNARLMNVVFGNGSQQLPLAIFTRDWVRSGWSNKQEKRTLLFTNNMWISPASSHLHYGQKNLSKKSVKTLHWHCAGTILRSLSPSPNSIATGCGQSDVLHNTVMQL